MASTDNPINDSRLPRSKRLNQHVGAFVASLGGFALGTAISWHSSAVFTLKNTLKNSTAAEIDNVGYGLYIGASVGALLLPLILRTLSHITVMFLTIPFFIFGWAFICLADQKVHMLIIGRVLCGVSGAIHSVVTPLYVSEISDKDIRGRLLTFFYLLVNCGSLYAYILAHIMHEELPIFQYSLFCGLSCVPMVMIIFLPESPIRLLTEFNERAAYKSLQWLKGKSTITEELKELQKYVLAKVSPRSLFKLLTNRQVLRSFFACFCVMITQQLSGINVMVPNARTVFDVGGSGNMNGSEPTIAVGLVQVASCILAALLVDLVGRQIMLTISTIIMGVLLVLLGWYFEKREDDMEFEDNFYWIPPLLIVLHFATINLGVGPLFWSLLGDSFPEEMKITAASFFAALNWAASFCSTKYVYKLFVVFGLKIIFVGAALCWVSAFFMALLVSNSKRKSLADIQKWFGFVDLDPTYITNVITRNIHNDMNQTETQFR